MDIVRPAAKQPIPPHAKKVFTGVVFDIYQWEQEMFDGTTKTFETLKRADSTVVIAVTADGKILVLEQEQPGVQPFAGVAGGRMEEGEGPLANAQRELLEETGYAAEEWVLWKSEQPSLKMDWALYTFIAKKARPVAEPAPDSGEKIKVRTVSFEEFADLSVADNFIEKQITMEFLKAGRDPEKMSALRKLMLD